jgi:putative spermidine/putrescine transport system permease protein
MPPHPVSSATKTPKRGVRRRSSAFFYRHRKTRLGLTISAPLLWLLIVYLVSLLLLLASSFWTVNALSGDVVRAWGWQNYTKVFTANWRTAFLEKTFFAITSRTVVMAIAVTAADVFFAFPIAYFAARAATARVRSAIVIAVVIPLWANYIIRVFAWKSLLEGGGPAQALLHAVGLTDTTLTGTNFAVWMTFSYLWLPYAILPIYAALERVPSSYIDASGDLGAHTGTTFRRIVLPLAIPGIVAGSIFTFCLTLGDYIVPTLVGKGLFLGNAIATYNVSNRPLAATISLIPLIAVAVYLALAKRTGAFEAL